MMSSKLTTSLMLDTCQNIWLGPSCHLVGYPIGDFFNIVAVYPGHSTLGDWTVPCNVNELQNAFSGFEPVVHELLHHVNKTAKWLLAEMPSGRWTSLSGKITLVGDAAHAMLPFLAQGAAQATEDAAVLSACLERASCIAEIPKMMMIYERLRRPRVEKIAAATRVNGEVMHLEDETEQNLRNEAMMKGSIYVPRAKDCEGEAEERQSLQAELSSGSFYAWMFKFDAIADVSTLVSYIFS